VDIFSSRFVNPECLRKTPKKHWMPHFIVDKWLQLPFHQMWFSIRAEPNLMQVIAGAALDLALPRV
jgi:hypothetical protein